MGLGKRNGGPSPGVWGGEEGNTQYTEKAQKGRPPLPDRIPTRTAGLPVSPLKKHPWLVSDRDPGLKETYSPFPSRLLPPNPSAPLPISPHLQDPASGRAPGCNKSQASPSGEGRWVGEHRANPPFSLGPALQAWVRQQGHCRSQYSLTFGSTSHHCLGLVSRAGPRHQLPHSHTSVQMAPW